MARAPGPVWSGVCVWQLFVPFPSLPFPSLAVSAPASPLPGAADTLRQGARALLALVRTPGAGWPTEAVVSLLGRADLPSDLTGEFWDTTADLLERAAAVAPPGGQSEGGAESPAPLRAGAFALAGYAVRLGTDARETDRRLRWLVTQGVLDQGSLPLAILHALVRALRADPESWWPELRVRLDMAAGPTGPSARLGTEHGSTGHGSTGHGSLAHTAWTPDERTERLSRSWGVLHVLEDVLAEAPATVEGLAGLSEALWHLRDRAVPAAVAPVSLALDPCGHQVEHLDRLLNAVPLSPAVEASLRQRIRDTPRAYWGGRGDWMGWFALAGRARHDRAAMLDAVTGAMAPEAYVRHPGVVLPLLEAAGPAVRTRLVAQMVAPHYQALRAGHLPARAVVRALLGARALYQTPEGRRLIGTLWPAVTAARTYDAGDRQALVPLVIQAAASEDLAPLVRQLVLQDPTASVLGDRPATSPDDAPAAGLVMAALRDRHPDDLAAMPRPVRLRLLAHPEREVRLAALELQGRVAPAARAEGPSPDPSGASVPGGRGASVTSGRPASGR